MISQVSLRTSKWSGFTSPLNKSVVVGQASLKLVMWGGTDITEAVTKALNAGFKPEMFRKP